MPHGPDYRPRLRNVEPILAEVQGRPTVVMRDPLQLAAHAVCLPQEIVPLLSLMDGRNSLRDIQEMLRRATGQIAFMDFVDNLVAALDEAFLLYGPGYEDAFRRKVQEYRRTTPVRPASHAGRSYSDDPAALRAELDGFFSENGGPGLPELFSEDRRPLGLVAPHIDVRAGGTSFARGYHALGKGQPSDVYVILGTGHAGVENMFTAATVDFQTPFGIAETDKEFVDELRQELGYDPASEEILHITEHVIEFQVVFLQHLFQGKHSFKIVPILCSLSHRYFDEHGPFAEEREVFGRFCQAIQSVCKKSSKTVCFIASADLDHIGPRYGDDFAPHETTIRRSLDEDSALLDLLERLDITGFVRQVAKDNDSRRICGFSPITTMFHCMEGASYGKRLALDMATVDDKNSFVTFTSMVFY